MKFLELTDFLNLFIREPRTLDEFIQIAQVKIGNKKEPLTDYMKRKTIDISKIKLLFENIEKRNNYLTRFYKLSLSIDKNKLHITDKPMIHNEMNNNIKLKYKNIVRNIHYQDILQNTTPVQVWMY